MKSSNQVIESRRAAILEMLADGKTSSTDLELIDLLEKHKRVAPIRPVIYYEDSEVVRAAGGMDTISAIRNWVEKEGLQIDYVVTGSFGFYSAQPVIGIQLPGRNRLFFGPVHDYQAEGILSAVFRHYIPEECLLGQWGEGEQHEWEGIPFLKDHAFFRGQQRRLLRLNGIIDPSSLLEYIAWGGYRAFAKSIRYYSHDEVISLVENAGLYGRSGSGFPAHVKWKKALSVPAGKRIVICNADESDPGGFMHRVLMEGNPHLVIEGLMLAAYAVGAGEAIIHTRTRYPLTVQRLEAAVDELRHFGLLGQDINGSGYSLEIKVRKGPGAYVGGEETALIASLEGKRGMPRPKPPWPAEMGLNGHPTLVHNVETLAHLSLIIAHGPKWYRSAGVDHAPGTKLYSLSGKFKNIGVLELPFGYSLNQLVSFNGGGTVSQNQPKAILAGGLSGKFIPSSQFDIPLDPEEFAKNDLELGSGSLVLLDDHSCIVDLVSHLMHFMQKESCGKCIPCREGIKRMAEIFEMVTRRPLQERGHDALHRFKGVTQLSSLATVISQTSLCGLGKGAANPVLSAFKHFRDEFEEHVFDRVCRAGVCQNLRTYYIDPEYCTGCYICYSKCPEQAIIGSPRHIHVIVSERCTGCGRCEEVCKFDAIYTK